MGVAKAIVLEEASRRDLERNSRGRSIASRVARRSRIVLLAARGLQNLEIADADCATHRESMARALSAARP